MLRDRDGNLWLGTTEGLVRVGPDGSVVFDREAARVQIAPLGLIQDEDTWVIAPFRPSTTLGNLEATPFAVANR